MKPLMLYRCVECGREFADAYDYLHHTHKTGIRTKWVGYVGWLLLALMMIPWWVGIVVIGRWVLGSWH